MSVDAGQLVISVISLQPLAVRQRLRGFLMLVGGMRYREQYPGQESGSECNPYESRIDRQASPVSSPPAS